jgi:predicted secreted protein
MRTCKAVVGVASLLVLAVVLSGCWLLPISIDETADGTAQSVEVGHEILIRLTGNAATGYQWIREAPESFDGTPLEVVSEGDYELDDPDVCGGPGVFTFRYRAVASGIVSLAFSYRKPWEDESTDAFSVIVWAR